MCVCGCGCVCVCLPHTEHHQQNGDMLGTCETLGLTASKARLRDKTWSGSRSRSGSGSGEFVGAGENGAS